MCVCVCVCVAPQPVSLQVTVTTTAHVPELLCSRCACCAPAGGIFVLLLCLLCILRRRLFGACMRERHRGKRVDDEESGLRWALPCWALSAAR